MRHVPDVGFHVYLHSLLQQVSPFPNREIDSREMSSSPQGLLETECLCPPLPIHMLKRNAQCDAVGRWSLMGQPQDGTSALSQSLREPQPLPPRGTQWDGTTRGQESGLWPGTHSVGTLIWDSHLQVCEISFCCVSTPHLWDLEQKSRIGPSWIQTQC